MLRWFGAIIHVTSHVPGKSIFDERTKLSFYFFSLSGYWDDIFNHTLQSDWIRNENQEKTILKVCCENRQNENKVWEIPIFSSASLIGSIKKSF
jgi:hypothetical protein